MICPFCEAEISNSARKCRHCGEWLMGESPTPPAPPPAPPPAAPPPQYYAPPAQVSHVNVNVQQPESVGFAVVTLLFWIFLAPIGLILNLIGIFTGPKRGCFVAMFLIFVVLPVVIVVLMLAAGVPLLDEIAREIERSNERSRY